MDIADPQWDGPARDLAGRLGRMPDKGAVVLTGPDEAPGEDAPRRGLLRRRPVPEGPPYVQFARAGDRLSAECVGPGHRTIAPETQERLVSAGWRPPGTPAHSSENYQRWYDTAQATTAAADGVGALRLLGADPATLRLEEID